MFTTAPKNPPPASSRARALTGNRTRGFRRVIDYAYTLDGVDPTLSGKYAEEFALGAPFPIDRLTARLLLPTPRRVSVRLVGRARDNPDFAPQQRRYGASTEYLWELRDLKSYPIETDTPGWYDPLPVVQISEFTSWGEVARWGEQLFFAA